MNQYQRSRKIISITIMLQCKEDKLTFHKAPKGTCSLVVELQVVPLTFPVPASGAAFAQIHWGTLRVVDVLQGTRDTAAGKQLS